MLFWNVKNKLRLQGKTPTEKIVRHFVSCHLCSFSKVDVSDVGVYKIICRFMIFAI